MTWPALLVTFGSFFALACGSSTSPSGLDQPMELAPGRSAQVGALKVTFTGVVSDSRCPVDVVCVWAGDAVARLEVSEPQGAVETRDLHTLQNEPAAYGRFRIALVRLDPEPRSTRPIAPDAYRLVVRVTAVN
jgi:hypothetical protein